ncbi:intermembrane space import and assembly protein 40 [Imleria badia]|nr:intermembrane space import and assembly protein 40 [Imleria badia]
MFRQFARLPLRRGLHSQASSSSRPFARYTRSAYALGASITLAGYLALSWSPNSRHISLDSEVVSTPKKQPTSLTPSRPSDAPTTPSTPRSDASEPATISPEGEQPSPVPSETPIEGEGAQGESSGGAFNPETGEINWDCPCLGGMAHGPCGQQFRDAFSCFVHSEADPKGIDCVEKFKAMQDCFREHPEVYADEIMDDDEEESPASPSAAEKKEGDLHSSENLSPETTEQPPASASS